MYHWRHALSRHQVNRFVQVGIDYLPVKPLRRQLYLKVVNTNAVLTLRLYVACLLGGSVLISSCFTFFQFQPLIVLNLLCVLLDSLLTGLF